MTDQDIPQSRIDRNEPLFQEARQQVMLEQLQPLIAILRKRPKPMTTEKTEHRLHLSHFRKFAWIFCLFCCFASGLADVTIHPVIAFIAGLLAATTALAVGVCLLGEVLIGAGWDVEVEYSGPEGPFRTYSFIPSIRGPLELFLQLALVIGGVMVGFAEMYLNLSRIYSAAFSHTLDRVSAFYLSVVTFATVGYGDIVPQSQSGKLIVITEILFGLSVVTVVFATSISWILTQRQQLTEARSADRDRYIQRRELLMKEHRLGAYADPGSLDRAALARMEQLRSKQVE